MDTPQNASAARLHLREATKLFRATGREYAQRLPAGALTAIREFVAENEASADARSMKLRRELYFGLRRLRKAEIVDSFDRFARKFL